MKHLKCILLLICSTTASVFAQSSDFFTLKEVKKYRFDRLELQNQDDVAYFVKNADEFRFVEALKLSGNLNIGNILGKAEICSYIRELDLTAYTGDIPPHVFDSCGHIEILALSLPEERLSSLTVLNGLEGLQTLYLFVSGRPESTTAFSSLPILKELHIIGEFLPADISSIFHSLRDQTFLQVLGISLDRITDIPAGITRFKTLNKLCLYDNLSVFAGLKNLPGMKSIEELSEEKFHIMFNMNTDMISAVQVSYFSSYGGLADFETEYLQSLYHGEKVFISAAEEANSKGAVTTTFTPGFKPDFPASPEFNPPYPKIQPQPEVFTINPGSNSIIYASSGMKITIPANCFTDADGNIISDPVYIRLTEYTNPADFLFAGFSFKNGSRQYCPGYMFNIQATSLKSTAAMRNGFQIRVVMPAAGDSSNMHFYDAESNTWQNLNFYNSVFAPSFIPFDFYKTESGSDKTDYFAFDTTGFLLRFEDGAHFLLNDKFNNSQMLFRRKKFFTDLDRNWNKEYNKDGKMKGLRVKKGKSYVRIQKVIPKVRNKNRQYFKILDKSGMKLLAELHALRNINFSVERDPENKRAFNEQYVKQAKYTDVEITYTRGKSECMIRLKTENGFKLLKAFITDSEDKKVIKKQLRRFYRAFRNYEKLRNERKNEFNELNESRFEEFRTYTYGRLNKLKKDGKFSEIKIPGLGTYGYLADSTPQFSTNIIAVYTDENGLPVDVRNLFLIDSRYNTVFSIRPGNISFTPSSCSMIVATDFSGNLYYANRDDVASTNLSDNSLTYIRLKKVALGVTTLPMFIHHTRY